MEDSWRAGKGPVDDLLKVLLVLCAPVLLLTVCSYIDPPGSRPLLGRDELRFDCHALGFALSNYCADHAGKYPEGKSSTEVFQKLLDEQYVTDPELFYVELAGKVKARPGAKLKPENVSFDFTYGLGPRDSGSVPVVFLTGFRVTYAPGVAAKSNGPAFPTYYPRRPATTSYFFGIPLPFHFQDRGIAVIYRDDDSTWIDAQGDSIPNFVPTTFSAGGKTYRQLTPDGVLR